MVKLVGHSGCNLEFIRNGNRTFIRKSSKSLSYNYRLESQCFKQQNFKHDTILAPKVLNTGYIDGFFYFDMEYVNGIRFNDFVKTNRFENVKHIFEIILKFITNNFTEQTLNKHHEIKTKINDILSTNLVDINISKELLFHSNESIRIGYCHGDLTFENIIISNNKIYLIDFLDSFIDSPIIDISKLLQEFDLNWSNRNDYTINNLSIIRNFFLKRELFNKIASLDIKENTILLQKKLTLMRILPYTNSIKLKLKLIELINN
jgi:predicted Ser/Thr protein kinase